MCFASPWVSSSYFSPKPGVSVFLFVLCLGLCSYFFVYMMIVSLQGTGMWFPQTKMFVCSLVALFVLVYNFIQSITSSTEFSDSPDQFSLRSLGTLNISMVHIHGFSLFLLLYTQTQIYTNTMRYELHGNIHFILLVTIFPEPCT